MYHHFRSKEKRRREGLPECNATSQYVVIYDQNGKVLGTSRRLDGKIRVAVACEGEKRERVESVASNRDRHENVKS